MRSVLDTNVLVSALLTPAGVCDRIVRAAIEGEFAACVVQPILDEYADVLTRPRINLSQENVAKVLKFMREEALFFAIEAVSLNLPDPTDEIFLAAAITGKADFLVTGNLKHFPPPLRHGINVVSPAQFLKHLTTA